MIERLGAEHFDWQTWRAGSIADLGIHARYDSITSNRGKEILKSYVIGYCPGEVLWCRPKSNHTALLVFNNDRYSWFHITNREFNEVFG